MLIGLIDLIWCKYLILIVTALNIEQNGDIIAYKTVGLSEVNNQPEVSAYYLQVHLVL